MKFEVSNSKYKILFPAVIELAREAIFAIPSANDRLDELGRLAIAFFLIVLGLRLRK